VKNHFHTKHYLETQCFENSAIKLTNFTPNLIVRKKPKVALKVAL